MIRLAMTFALLALSAAAAFAGCPAMQKAGDGAPPLMRPAKGEIQKPFGMILHPLLNQRRLHAGLDFRGDTGDSVAAAADGIVREAGRNGEYGNLVILDHGAGWQTAYAHLDSIAVVTGACVPRGARIGNEGSTGLSSGPHLHFEVRFNGRPLDPAPLLPAAGP